MDFGPRRFLDEDDIKLDLSLENSIYDEWVFLDVLQKDPKVLYDHCWGPPLTIEQINLTLFSWISAYFFCCHSVLNLCLQNGHRFKSAWWSPWQFEHLNVCGHGSPFFVLSRRGFDFSLALQHHPNLWWFSNLWRPLHLTYLDPWILQENIKWPHFQQFLHWGIPRFMLAPQIVAMYLLTLKHWLMSSLVLLPLWTSQISIQTMDMSDLGEILMTLGLDTRLTLLKIWFCFKIVSMSLEIRWSWVLLWEKYRIPVILRYDFDWGRWDSSTLRVLMSLEFLTYWSII